MSHKISADITLVLNVHDETRYLHRTVESLKKSVFHAKISRLRFELVIVLDRPALSTEAWFKDQNFSIFDHVVTIKCNHGSLGPARNEGISVATGEYIATCDADDLISFNMFAELYASAKRSGPKAIVIPQYLFAFGQDSFLVEYHGTDYVNKLGFLTYHPSVSRIFAHRSIFDINEYADASPSSGYAFEDWHFACEAIAQGCDFAIGRDTILFYRRRPNSLARIADRSSIQQIPPTALFEPKNFISCCAQDFGRFRNGDVDLRDPAMIIQEFTHNPIISELVCAASELDPAITAQSAFSLPAYSNLSPPLVGGATYYRICQLIERRRFTDVFLIPSFEGDSGNRFLDIIDDVIRLQEGRSFLIILTEGSQSSLMMERQSDGFFIIDLTKTEFGCPESDLHIITLRLLEQFGPTGVIHVGISNFIFEFVRKFYPVLHTYKLILYRQAAANGEHANTEPTAGDVFNFISEFGEFFSFILADNEGIIQHDVALLDTLADRYVLASTLSQGIASYTDAISLPRHNTDDG